MEVMDASLDKFYQNIYKNGERIPEEVLGKIAFSVSAGPLPDCLQFFGLV